MKVKKLGRKISIKKILAFSRKEHINIFRLIYYILSPRPKFRLTDALKISKALGLSIDELTDIQIDIRKVA